MHLLQGFWLFQYGSVMKHVVNWSCLFIPILSVYLFVFLSVCLSVFKLWCNFFLIFVGEIENKRQLLCFALATQDLKTNFPKWQLGWQNHFSRCLRGILNIRRYISKVHNKSKLLVWLSEVLKQGNNFHFYWKWCSLDIKNTLLVVSPCLILIVVLHAIW